ncbi:MAG: efflux RND transporter permease subunit [Balneolaceae bacterium]
MEELFRRKYLISFFYLMVCIVGYSAWKGIPVENAPELNLPSITISYYWGSTAPEVVEKEITRKVESAANRLRDVSKINSITEEGRSSVSVQFTKNAPVEFRALEIREYLHSLEQTLPANVNPAQITRQVPEEIQDQQTFMVYSLSGNLPARELLEYAQQTIKTKLLGLEGLTDVRLQGVESPALFIEFDRDKLEKFELSGRQILAQVRTKLNWRSSGIIDAGSARISMIIPPDFENTADISSMRIEIPGSLKQLYLSDIAHVYVGDYPSKSIRRINGSPALTIDMVKESGADAMSLAKTVIEVMKEVENNLPSEMDLRLQVDSTEKLREQFDQLGNQAMFSALLVFLVMLLFIRKIRAPFVIIGSVVFSVLMSITVLYMSNYTLNVITLAGLTIALGMLIDNAVVVFEQVNPGLPVTKEERIAHIKNELPKSVVPVLGSTFTTVGIFIPLLFALDELRIFLMPLAVALTITLVSSVIIAFTWIPYALIWLTPALQRTKVRSKKSLSSRLQRPLLLLLIWRNRLRWIFILVLIATIGIPLFLIKTPEWNDETKWPEFTKIYFDNRNEIDPWIGGVSYRFKKDTYFGSPWRGSSDETVNVYIRTPQGTPLSEIDKIVKNYEAIAKPYAHSFNYYEARLSEYFGATLTFSINSDYLYSPAPYYFLGEAMYLAARTGNVATSVSGFGDGISTGFGGSSSSYTIRLTGYSYDELYDLAREIERRLSKSRRVREIDINSSSYYSRDDFYQYELELNEEELLAKGLNRREVLSALAIDINPVNSFGRVEFEGQEMFLIGRSEAQNSYEEDLMNKVRTSSASSFNLSSIGRINKRKALTQIRRTDQSYERNVTLNYLGNYRMGNEYVEGVLKEVPVPVGAKIDFGRRFFSSGNDKNTANLILVALLSILSVWMIVSALLESWTGPLFVLLTIPFSLVGIMIGTLVNSISFDKGAIAGALLCIGIVVNNAILLIHHRDMEKKRGVKGLRCWFNVFKSKMRTVLITTTTTVVGLLPMIYYGTDDFWQGLAVVVCWGLLFSTGLLFLLAGSTQGKFRVSSR